MKEEQTAVLFNVVCWSEHLTCMYAIQIHRYVLLIYFCAYKMSDKEEHGVISIKK